MTNGHNDAIGKLVNYTETAIRGLRCHESDLQNLKPLSKISSRCMRRSKEKVKSRNARHDPEYHESGTASGVQAPRVEWGTNGRR